MSGQFGLPYGQQAAALAAKNKELLEAAQKHNMAVPAGYGVPAQGPGGVFGGPMEPSVFNAMMLPQSGLMNALPVRSSTRHTVAYSIISGVTDTVNPDGTPAGVGGVNEPTGTCDDPPMAGLAKMCTFAAPWGRWSRQSRILDISSLGEDEYCDTPLDLIGGFANNNLAPMGWQGMSNDVLRSTPAKALMELGVSFVRDFAKLFFTGNPANNTSGGGYQEFNGLERLINTGYTDMITGLPCAAADSLVRNLTTDFGLAKPEDDPQAFMAIIRDMYNNMQFIAEQAGLSMMQGAFVMPRWMFDCLVRLWACAYLTDRCGNTTTQVWSTSTDWIQFRDSMLQNRYLLIDGMAIPVIIDDSQPYTVNLDGSFTGTLFYVPLTVLGGIPVLYQQYKPFNVSEINNAIRDFVGNGSQFKVSPSPNGAFLIVYKTPVNTCVQVMAITKRRMVLHTPYLAFRMDGVTCQRTVPYRGMFPSDPNYVNGGRTGEPSWFNNPAGDSPVPLQTP